MAHVIFGSNKTPIGVDEFLLDCPSCEAHRWADVMVSSLYFHVYWLPIFPYQKQADAVCKQCGLKRYGRSFNQSFISNIREVEKKFRHPWFTYTGTGVITLLVLSIVIARILR